MEEAVQDMILDVLEGLDCCKCEKCILDIKAIALNNLPPKYVVTEKGLIFKKVDALIQQFEVDIISAIAKATVIVRKYPRH